jgi:hypothetical protein
MPLAHNSGHHALPLRPEQFSGGQTQKSAFYRHLLAHQKLRPLIYLILLQQAAMKALARLCIKIWWHLRGRDARCSENAGFFTALV